MTYYKVLGVSRKATKAQIKKAYRKLAFLNHPDRSKKKNAKELFQKIAQAYVILSDKASRKNYDKSIKDIVTKEKKEGVIFTRKAFFKYRVSIIRMTTITRKVHHLMHLTLTRSVYIGDIVMGKKLQITYSRCVRCELPPPKGRGFLI